MSNLRTPQLNFENVLWNGEDQVIVKKILLELVPPEIKQLVIKRFNLIVTEENKMTIKPILIEDVSKSPTEWGVSITSSNPEPADYFQCADKDHALRLCALLEGRQDGEETVDHLDTGRNEFTDNLPAIIQQLEACGYQCIAGPLEMNTAFIELKRISQGEQIV